MPQFSSIISSTDAFPPRLQILSSFHKSVTWKILSTLNYKFLCKWFRLYNQVFTSTCKREGREILGAQRNQHYQKL